MFSAWRIFRLLASPALSISLLGAGIPAAAQEQASDEINIRIATHLDEELSRIQSDISASEEAEKNYAGGALSAIAALNTETLRLTQSVLQARKVAADGNVPIDISMPGVKPDPDLAGQILADIERQQSLVDEAYKEAKNAGGLVSAMAFLRYETERLSLAQLRQAWYRSQYGIAFPTTGVPVAPEVATGDEKPDASSDDGANTVADAPEWADPNFPEIDYTAVTFEQFANSGFDFSGWWAIEKGRAEIDDSPKIIAINISDWGAQFSTDNPSLRAVCAEGSPRFIYDADTYLMSNTNPANH